MKQRTVMHKEGLNVVVKFKKSDFAGQIYKEANREYLLAGTLVNVKTAGEDIRKKGVYVKSATAGTKADGILMHNVEFVYYHDEEIGTVTIEGVAYLDKLIEVGKEHPTPLTVTEAELPSGVTYVNKDRD